MAFKWKLSSQWRITIILVLCYSCVEGNELFEGDIAGIDDPIIFTQSFRDDIFHNGQKETSRMWDGGIIPYQISHKFTIEQKITILKAMQGFNNTCIQFVDRIAQEYFIFLAPGKRCWSHIGKSERNQTISLHQSSCMTVGTIQHELMHAIGFYHEHSKADRDEYVDIIQGNIEREFHKKKFTYTSAAINAFGQPYDFDSIMHYDNKSFARDKSQPTILPKPQYQHNQIGQRRGLSRIDIQKINLMYNCLKESNNRLLPGEVLWTNRTLISNNNKIKLILHNGNVVISNAANDEIFWTVFSTVEDHLYPFKWGGPIALHMQTDGNVVIYNSKMNNLWESGTAGVDYAGAELMLENDGVLCLVKNDNCLWRSAVTEVKSGEVLRMRQTLWSTNKSFKLIMFGESGIAVLPGNNFNFISVWDMQINMFGSWDRKWSKNHPLTLQMQLDGNLVLFDSKREMLWESGTIGNEFTGADMRLDDDGQLCLFQSQNNSQCLWQSAVTEVKSGDYLRIQQTLWSMDKITRLIVMDNGIVTITNHQRISRNYSNRVSDFLIWAGLIFSEKTSQYLIHHPIKLQMQSDGNIVISNSTQQRIWESGTNDSKFAGSVLRLDNEGSMCLFKNEDVIWKSDMFEIESGGILWPGNILWSGNRKAKLLMLMNGDVEIDTVKKINKRKIIWRSEINTSFYSYQPSVMTMLRSGNLIIHKHGQPNQILLDSRMRTESVPGASLRLNDDGSLCFFKGNTCVAQLNFLEASAGIQFYDIQRII